MENVDPVADAVTFGQLVRLAAQTYGDAPAVSLSGAGAADETVSFADVERRSAELARGLIANGVGKGARVGFLLGNGPDFVVVLAAVARIGAVAVPISTMLKAGELVRVLRRSDVGGLIVQRELLGRDCLERLHDALPELRAAEGPALRIASVPYLRWVCSSGRDLPTSVRDRASLLADGATVSEALLAEIEAEVFPTDQMIEIYTSGSMAAPKGVRHDHGPVTFRALWLRGALGIGPGDRRPVFLPMFWVGGLMLPTLTCLAAGALAECSEATLNNSRVAMGSVLAADDMAMMRQAKPYWGLGMSETIGPYSWGDELRAEGRPVCAPMDHVAPGYEMRVVDADDRPVADGEVGAIQLRGYAVTPGLHKLDPRELFTPDGFYRTGDTGLVDGARVHFVGRDGDMIKTAGSNVSPAEVEMEMQALDGVHSAYVVGLPDAERGQLVVAAVVPRDGAVVDGDALQATLRQRLSPYKVPRAYVPITREEVPLLASNKVARREIAALLAARLGRTA